MPFPTPLPTLRMASSCSTRLAQDLQNWAVDHGINSIKTKFVWIVFKELGRTEQ
jgi:hypothetical protein